jgi:transcriptional regulator with XRE-family HTH domain
MTQEELAEKCGIFRTYLSRIESGNANLTLVVLVALASSLRVQPQDLLHSREVTQAGPARAMSLG